MQGRFFFSCSCRLCNESSLSEYPLLREELGNAESQENVSVYTGRSHGFGQGVYDVKKVQLEINKLKSWPFSVVGREE
jgi:hypothetical protein